MTKTIRDILLALFVLALALSTGEAIPANAASIPAALKFVPVMTNLTAPDFITNAGDGSNRLFILQQTGQIRIFKNGSLLSTPFLNLSGLVSNFTGLNGEQGLLGLAFDPQYSTNGYFYITYTTNNSDPTFIFSTTLARYHVSNTNPDLADTTSGAVLLTIPKKYSNHNGGMLAFGPDGYLYMSMGDGGSGGDPDNNAQNIHTLLGKLLRLDVHTTPPAGKKYVIPSTNPFFSSSDPNVRQEIWAYGLRNPWRFSFDRSNGDLFIGDVGQGVEEEVDFQSASSTGGENYGWRILEGNLCFNPSSNCVPPSGYIPPVATYDHGVNDSYGCAITGGYVYRGKQSPALQGVYFYGDFCSGKVLGLIKNANNTWSSSLIASTSYSISSFGEDEQGELYLADYNAGTIYRISSPSVLITGNVGLAGVRLSTNDGVPITATSLADGSYSLEVPQGWSGTVTPSLVCFTFNPLSLSYANVMTSQTSQNYTYTRSIGSGCAYTSILISATNQGLYGLPPGAEITPLYPGMIGGPVKVQSDLPVFTSERALYGPYHTFNEVMGYPDNQLTTKYWFPWYDGTSMTTWVLVDNPSTSATATVHIKINGSEMPGSPFTIGPGLNITPQFPGVLDGPVEVSSNINVFASERALYGPASSFNEVMAYPDNQLTKKYWFPWYDDVSMSTWVLVGNPDAVNVAHVHIKINGSEMPGSPFSIDPGKNITPRFPGVMAGPVEVSSDVNVFTSERALYGPYNTFNEVMGYPDNRLAKKYWFSWYDDVSMQTWVLVGNPSATNTATVHITIHGVDVPGSPFSLEPGKDITPHFPGVLDGPVLVSSDINVFASERALYGPASSFNEVMGYPDDQLTNVYWFPWYDNASMTTWVLVGKP